MQVQPFDAYAKTYDAHFTNSLIGKAQRVQVYGWVKKFCNLKAKSLLEINCGTGVDAEWLAKNGATVLATDASVGMIDVAKHNSTSTQVTFEVRTAQNIGTLAPTNYELIFSNFGGLNCLTSDELVVFKQGCSSLQKSRDKVVLVVMGTGCFWERLYFYMTHQKEKAKRRLKKAGVHTVINGESFNTYYYTPQEFITLFSDRYTHITTKPIGLFVPPSYLEPYFIKRKKLVTLFSFLDNVLGRFSFLSNWADHYLIVFEKK